MNLLEFKEYFSKEAKKNNIEFKEDKLELLYKYMEGILEWNEKINVTSITDEKMFIVKHFLDSLTVMPFIKEKKSLIDIGTGAGFPGIPLNIMCEGKKITLIDSINKKLNIIRDLSEKLNLINLEIIHTRAEDLAIKKEYREKYDIATTRAVSNISTILEYMLPFLNKGGIAICMKGPNYKDELENSKKAIEVLGGNLKEIKTIKINEDERNLIIIEKVKETPKNFPRGKGKPLKEPIR